MTKKLAQNPKSETWMAIWRAADVAVPSARESISHDGVGASCKYKTGQTGMSEASDQSNKRTSTHESISQEEVGASCIVDQSVVSQTEGRL